MASFVDVGLRPSQPQSCGCQRIRNIVHSAIELNVVSILCILNQKIAGDLSALINYRVCAAYNSNNRQDAGQLGRTSDLYETSLATIEY